MNEEIKENGLVEGENEKKRYVFSWRKLCCWFALLASITSPVIGIGLGIISVSCATEDEKAEVSVISYIAIAIGLFFVVYDVVMNAVLL